MIAQHDNPVRPGATFHFDWRTTESLLLLARSSMLNRSHTLLRSAPVQAIHRGEAAHQVQRDGISGSNTYRQPDIWLIADCHPDEVYD
jgi:hypothetical protein